VRKLKIKSSTLARFAALTLWTFIVAVIVSGIGERAGLGVLERFLATVAVVLAGLGVYYLLKSFIEVEWTR